MLMYYQDFIAEIKYISRTRCFYGEVINKSYFIVFQAEYQSDLDIVFRTAVEQYLSYLKQQNINNLIAVDLHSLEKETLV